MATTRTASAKSVRNLSAEVAYLTRALKAPALRESVARLAERGPSGTGKTHLAIGPAIRACQAGHRVLFATAAD